jgi:hypothetical protein
MEFKKLVYVGDTVSYRLTARTEKKLTIDATIGPVTAARFTLGFGAPRPPAFELDAAQPPATPPETPVELTLAEMARQAGCLQAPATVAEIAAAFPHAARIWPPERLLAMLSITMLVGKVCPGLHSLLACLTLHAAPPGGTALRYRTIAADARLRMVRIQVQGSGVHGIAESLARTKPVLQPAMADLAGLCAPNEFAGATALIIGGSRGLGELTAKLLALGGAKTLITYASGRDDAEAVAGAIRATGATCEVFAYDCAHKLHGQLAGLPAITHLYYFATTHIFRRKSGLLDADRLAEFTQCYVTGFYDLFTKLHAASPAGLTAFYPSSIYVEDRPKDLTEFAMAKAAGEVLCADLNAYVPRARIIARRLPRLPTDQTAAIMAIEAGDPVAVMLPIIREVQGQKA